MRKAVLILLVCIFTENLFSQTCTNLGQNPSTAFPVCGSTVFKQTSVPICGTKIIPTPCTANGSLFQDKNPYWYKFTCFKAGTLGFEILPSNLSDDYDWQLFDITNRDPNAVFSDKTMFVACNWSGESGRTGANASGTSLAVCEGYGRPLFSKMPDLILGHEYLLLVSHFTDTQSGYSLSFGGGTGSITDSTASTMNAIRPNCDGKTISIRLNKNMRCSSLAADGSDFGLSSPNIKITKATGVNCGSGFDMDSVVLQLDNPLAPGNYTIVTKKGSDGNTLLDYCDAAMKEGVSGSFTVTSLQPTPFDSISAVGCSPGQLQVVFSKPILCSSVAANGSDFIIDASSGVTVTGTTTGCSNNVTSQVLLNLSGPINKQGRQQVTLVKGTDGNSILDECLQETLPGSTVRFMTYDTVNAAINYTIGYSCLADTVEFGNPGGNGINQWSWKFNERAASAQQNPVYIYTQFGQQKVRLMVSNGVCRDSAEVSFLLDNELKADFTAPSLLCPQDQAVCRDSSIGKITSWKWNFGNGTASSLQMPPPFLYTAPAISQTYYITLTVQNGYNCSDTITKPVKVLSNCYIAVATAFTPNGDGRNDYLYPINAFKAENLVFKVYNRFGQIVFQTTDFTQKWDGTYKGSPQQSGTYAWTLQYTHANTGEPFFMKGTSVLIR